MNKKHPNADGNTTGESSKKDDEDGDNDGTAKQSTNKKILCTDSDLDQFKFTFRKSSLPRKYLWILSSIIINKELDGMSPRRIYDKIRKIISQDSFSQAVSELPEARELLEEKLQHLTSTIEMIATLMRKCQLVWFPLVSVTVVPQMRR